MEIKTKEQWWAAFDEGVKRWPQWLDDIAVDDMLERADKTIYAKSYHALYDEYRGKTLYQVFDDCRQRNLYGTLTLILNQIWIDAPDSKHIHDWPGWHILCDLCSEAWVFEEDQ